MAEVKSVLFVVDERGIDCFAALAMTRKNRSFGFAQDDSVIDSSTEFTLSIAEWARNDGEWIPAGVYPVLRYGAGMTGGELIFPV